MKNTKQRLLIFTLIASLISAVLYLTLSAIYAVVISNILYLSGPLPLVIEAGVWLIGILSYAVIFAIFIFSTNKLGTRQTIPVVLLYCATILFKNLANTIIQSYILGIHTTLPDLLLPIANSLLEALLAFVVIIVAKYKLKKDTALSANPLNSIALLVSILISATKFLPRIVYDIGYGAPSSPSDLLIMLLAYVSDISIIAIIYFVSRFTFKFLQQGE